MPSSPGSAVLRPGAHHRQRRLAQRLSATLLHRPVGHLSGRASARCGVRRASHGRDRGWSGRTLFDMPTGLVAAALLAVAPLAVIDSHYVKHDVRRNAGNHGGDVAAVALLARRRCRGAVCRPATWSSPSMACGVAWSIHYYCVFLAVPLAADGSRRQAHRRMAGDEHRPWRGAPGGRWSSFFVLSPFLLVEPARPGATSSRTVRSWWTAPPITGCSRTSFGTVMLLVDGLTLPVVAARRDRHGEARSDRPSTRAAAVFVSRAVPAVHQQHRPGEPLSQSGRAVCRADRGAGASRISRPRWPPDARR